MADRKIAAEVQVNVTGQEDLDTAAETVDRIDHATADVTVATTGVAKTTEQLDAVEAMRQHITDSPAVIDIQSNFDQARGDLEHAEAALGNVEQAASGVNGEIAGIAGNIIGQVPGVDQATGQMASSLGNVANAAGTLGSAATGAGTVAALAMYGIQKGADQAAERTDNLVSSFDDLAKASDAAFTRQAQQVWSDAILRSALDGKKLTDQFKDLAANAPAVAQRMLDNADAIGLNANAQKILTDALAANAAETAQAKKTQDDYAASTKGAAAAADDASLSVHDYVAMLASIPADKRTQIQAAIDRGDLATAERLLNEAARDRTAVISVLVRGINIGAQIGAQVRAGAAAGGGQVVSITNVTLPAGARGIDALREITGAARRVGTRYGAAAVSRARR